MSYPVPEPGHAIVIANIDGRLYAVDVIAEEMNWEAQRNTVAWMDMGTVRHTPTSWYDRLTLRGFIAVARVYDPRSGQMHDEYEQAAIEPQREELEP